jgi:hypothetical protein
MSVPAWCRGTGSDPGPPPIALLQRSKPTPCPATPQDVKNMLSAVKSRLSCPKCAAVGSLSLQMETKADKSVAWILRCLAKMGGVSCRAKVGEKLALAMAMKATTTDTAPGKPESPPLTPSVTVVPAAPIVVGQDTGRCGDKAPAPVSSPSPTSNPAPPTPADDIQSPGIASLVSAITQLTSVVQAMQSSFAAQITALYSRMDQVESQQSRKAPSYAAVVDTRATAPPTIPAPANRPRGPGAVVSAIVACPAAAQGPPTRSRPPPPTSRPPTPLTATEATRLAASMRLQRRSEDQQYVHIYVDNVRPRGLGQTRAMLSRLGIRPRPMELSFLGRSPILEITLHAAALESTAAKLTELGFSIRTGLKPEDESLMTGDRWKDATMGDKAAEARRCYITRIHKLMGHQVRPSMTGFLTKELHRLGASPPKRPATTVEVNDGWTTVTRRRRPRRPPGRDHRRRQPQDRCAPTAPSGDEHAASDAAPTSPAADLAACRQTDATRPEAPNTSAALPADSTEAAPTETPAMTVATMGEAAATPVEDDQDTQITRDILSAMLGPGWASDDDAGPATMETNGITSGDDAGPTAAPDTVMKLNPAIRRTTAADSPRIRSKRARLHRRSPPRVADDNAATISQARDPRSQC